MGIARGIMADYA